MAQYSSWIHGVAVQQQFTDSAVMNQYKGHAMSDDMGYNSADSFAGAPGYSCKHFSGKKGSRNYFHIPIPTPTFIGGKQANLIRVMVLYSFPLTENSQMMDLWVYDGPNQVYWTGMPQLATAYGPPGADGLYSNPPGSSLVENATQFTLPNPTAISWGLNIILAVQFNADEDIAFTAAGADFDA